MKAPNVMALLLVALILLATVPDSVNAAKPVVSSKKDVDDKPEPCPSNYEKKEYLPSSCVCAAVSKCGGMTGPTGMTPPLARSIEVRS
jgi:hypothetical protein